MDIFLRFRSKRHSESYSHALELQIQKRLVMLVSETSVFLVMNIVSYSLNPKVVTLSSGMLSLSRVIATLLVIIGLYLIRRNARRLQRFAVLINLLLDLILAFVPFAFYPVLGTLSVDAFSKLGVYVWAWSACILAISTNYLIVNWWMRYAIMLIEMSYFFIFVWEREPYALAVFLIGVEALLYYFILSYFNERYQRLDFYEKRKIYDNYEAIKKIFDDISQGILIVDNKNEIVYSNKTVNLLFNQAQEQNQEASSLMNLLSQEFISTLNEYMKAIKKTLFEENHRHDSIVLEAVLTSQNKNTNLSIKFTKSLFMEKQVLVLNITDNTDRDLLVAANASNEYKSRLLSSVSHELRTPLNGSINFTEQALSEPMIPTEMKEKWLVPALRGNQLLLFLVNDILDFSQMHAGKLRLVFESKNVVDSAKECIELVELQARKKKLKLELQNNLSPSEEILKTDHNRLKQIMLNLLSNAVKFTFEGSVSLILDPISSSSPPFIPQETQRSRVSPLINVRKLSVSSTTSYFPIGVRLTVKDTGIGISPENQKKLFQAFEKLELENKSLTINSTGAGLGLVISNNLVQRLSPKELTRRECEVIKFVSKEKVGSTFYFEVYNREEKSNRLLDVLNEKNEMSVCSDTGLGLLYLEELKREVSPKRNDLYKETLDTVNLKTDSPTFRESDLCKLKTLITNCKCSKILIVDDDTFNLTALDMILSKLSFTCDWALNGKQAVDKIKTRQLSRCSKTCQQYRLMFLDCQMPILNGFETAKLLKRMMNDGEIDWLRIVGCTAFIQEADEKKARQAGMDDFCTKPINMKMISDKIKPILK